MIAGTALTRYPWVAVIASLDPDELKAELLHF